MPTTAPDAASTMGPPEEPGVGSVETSMYGNAEDVPGYLQVSSQYYTPETN